MKKRALFFVFVLFFIGIVSAESCVLTPSLINQDPSEAVPGEYMEVVFQLEGVSDPTCGKVKFEVLEKYPFEVQGEKSKEISSGTFTYGYQNYWMIPYRILIDENAIDGDEEIEVKYSSENSLIEFIENFSIYIQDPSADFEIHVKDYDSKKKELVLEVLNIEDVDIEALTLEIPRQANIEVKGPNRIVVGDLDSNEYTTATFEANLSQGEIIIEVLYTDEIGIRRTKEETIYFEPAYFQNRAGESKDTSASIILWSILVAILIVLWIIKKIKKRNKKNRMNSKGMVKF